MEDLIVRLEAATGPDRELDALIKELVGHQWDYAADWGSRGAERPAAFPYTASIDAAMTLVPEQWKLRQLHFNAPSADDRKWNAQLHGGRHGEDLFTGFSASRPLALCIAALKARATLRGGEIS